MLKRLLKYDLYDSYSRAWPFLCGVGALCVACLGTLFFALNLTNSVVVFLLYSFYALCLGLMALLFLVISFFAPIRYYKSLFTEESYLTRAIPVSSSKLIFSKLLAVIVFEASLFLVAFVAYFGALGLPLALFDSELLFETAREIAKLLAGDFYASTSVFVIYLLSFVVEYFCGVITLLCSLSVGGLIFGRHRLFGALLVFFGVTAFVGLVELIAGFFVGTLSDLQTVCANLLVSLLGTATLLLSGAVMYFINLRLIDKSLDYV